MRAKEGKDLAIFCTKGILMHLRVACSWESFSLSELRTAWLPHSTIVWCHHWEVPVERNFHTLAALPTKWSPETSSSQWVSGKDLPHLCFLCTFYLGWLEIKDPEDPGQWQSHKTEGLCVLSSTWRGKAAMNVSAGLLSEWGILFCCVKILKCQVSLL